MWTRRLLSSGSALAAPGAGGPMTAWPVVVAEADVVTSRRNMDLDLTTEEFTTEVVEAAVEAEAG